MPSHHFATCLLVAWTSAISHASIITVDDDGPADYATIQAAVDAAEPGDTILVAPGTYVGTEPTDQVVDLLGKAITLESFSGPETTIIDGENRNRGLLIANGEGLETIIDGFTITNCRKADGAGAYVSSANPTIRNCIIRDNSGEGVYLVNSSANLSDCIFQGNRDAFGAGVRGFGSNPVILDCQFIDNWGLTDGGGLHFADCGGSIDNCVFTLNRAGAAIEGVGDGGGAYISTNSTTTVSECTFAQNNANADGGGLYYLSSSVSLTLRECTFINNHASAQAGGLFFRGSPESLIQIESCTFQANSAPSLPVARIEGNCEIRTCMISGNIATADQTYSGLRIYGGDTCVISDCVVENNEGGGIAAVVSPITSLVISDCTFESNIGGHLATFGDDINISGCRFADLIGHDTQFDWGAIWHYPTAGNSTNITNCVFESNDYAIRIQREDTSFIQISDCRFIGHTLPVFDTYVAEEIQYQNSIFCENSGGLGEAVDLGNNCHTASCEDSDGDGRPDLCDQQVDIQALIEQADEGDTIVIPAGTHLINRTLDTLGKAITIRGEFDAEGNPLTVLDGQGVMRILRCRSLETNNTVFDGLVFNDGRDYYWGGGIVINWAAPRFENCVISNCQSILGGGGVCVYQPTNATDAPVFNNCRFINNSTPNDGGGMSVLYSGDRVQIDNCLFEGNTAEAQGGGIYVGNSGSAILTSTLLCTNLPNDLYESTIGNAVDNGGNCIGDCDDDDGDGVLNCNDDCPDDPNQTSDVDTDGDGTADCADGCPLDHLKVESGLCGCGVADTDLDGDGLICDDPCPTWAGDCSDDGLTLYVAVGDSINEAIQGVIPGGTVLLLEGTHPINTPINPNGKAFTLRGELDADGEPRTILSGQGLNRILECTSGETNNTSFTGLVFTAGQSTQGGALYCSNSSPAFDSCIFLGNSALTGGAAFIRATESGSYQPQFIDCRFDSNTATDDSGGAIYAYSSYYDEPAIDLHIQVTRSIFTLNIARGVLDGSESNYTAAGGAIYLSYCSSMIEQSEFNQNTAEMTNMYSGGVYDNTGSAGGAIYISGSATSPTTIRGTHFSHNTARGVIESTVSTEYGPRVDPEGGAIYSYYSNIDVEGCTFYRNQSVATLNSDAPDTARAWAEGGAISLTETIATIRESDFTENTTPSEVWASGGAVCVKGFNQVRSDTILLNCQFDANRSNGGGAIDISACCYTADNVDSTMNFFAEGCSFTSNVSEPIEGWYAGSGGAIEMGSNSVQLNAHFTNCLFHENISTSRGGGITTWTSSSQDETLRLVLQQCELSENSAVYGGAIYQSSHSVGKSENLAITESVIFNNFASSNYGGIYFSSATTASFANTNVCSNQPSQVSGTWNDLGGNCVTESCDSDQDGVDDCNDQCPGESDTDSDFDGTADCNDECPFDPDKIESGLCGCGEVDDDSDSDGDGVYDCNDQCPGSPDIDTDGDGIFDCIDPCIEWPGDCSEDGETYYVAEGQSIQIAINLVPSGGFVVIEPGEYDLKTPLDLNGKPLTVMGSLDENGQPATVIDGGSTSQLVQCRSGEGPDSRFVDLVFRNGMGVDGGAVNIEQSSPRFERCGFFLNTASGSGGAVFITQSNPDFIDCDFLDNTASDGGAIANEINGSPSLLNCVFTGNLAESGGAILNTFGSSPTLDDCHLEANEATGPFGGGGIWSSDLTGSTPALVDTTVCGNLPDQMVGGYADNGGNLVDENCDGTPCPTDLNGDGITDGADLGIFFVSWNACGNCPADLNNDGNVDGQDLGLLFAGWGDCS